MAVHDVVRTLPAKAAPVEPPAAGGKGGRSWRPPSRRAVLTCLILGAALWGMIVDSPVIALLAPTGNSTLFQASTAAFFAVIGILFGPLPGALGGLIRDGTGYALALVLHPGMISQPGFVLWLGRAAADILEDVVLGLVPGLVALRTRRVDLLALASAAAAWLSLPFLVAANALFSAHPGQIWVALGTATGDWDEPVDPGLTVYALLTGALVALLLTRRSSHPRMSLAIALLFAVPAALLIALGAHY